MVDMPEGLYKYLSKANCVALIVAFYGYYGCWGNDQSLHKRLQFFKGQSNNNNLLSN